MDSARTFVLTRNERIVGYFSLTIGSVLRQDAPAKGRRRAAAFGGASQGDGPGLEILFAQHVEVPELQRTVADFGEEGGELSCLRAARVLHSLLVG
ncbi:MAG: hypothetical protein QOJ67_1335 [Acidimicrobiaceae bacterium]